MSMDKANIVRNYLNKLKNYQDKVPFVFQFSVNFTQLRTAIVKFCRFLVLNEV